MKQDTATSNLRYPFFICEICVLLWQLQLQLRLTNSAEDYLPDVLAATVLAAGFFAVDDFATGLRTGALDGAFEAVVLLDDLAETFAGAFFTTALRAAAVERTGAD